MTWSAPVALVVPAERAVSLDQAKEFLRIDDDVDEFDGQIDAFLAAAIDQLEATCSIRLSAQTVRIGASDLSDLLRLPIGPVSALTAVEYTDRSGEVRAIDPADLELIGGDLDGGIRTVIGKGWPNDIRSGRDAIRVTLEVGYDIVPAQLQTAVLLMVSDQFEFRTSAVTGTVAARIPTSMAVETLIANHRVWLS